MGQKDLSDRKGGVMNSRWSLSEHRVDPGTARCGVIWQHEHIRALLDMARSVISEAAAWSPKVLVTAIADIRSALEAHFAYEEKHWLPVLRRGVPVGEQVAEEILAEHDRQRDFVAGLYREACACSSSPGLASNLTFLAAWLRSHMADEERYLVLRNVGRDDFFVIPQAIDPPH